MISRTLNRLVANGGIIAVAMGVMNIGTMGFTLVAAWLLEPRQYGGVAAVMNLLLVISVASLGIQATAARRIAAHPEDVAEIEHTMRDLTRKVVLPFALVLLIASPLVKELLKLESIWTAVVVALASIPLTVFGVQAGILQGERRWAPLAWMYVAAGIPRLLLGVVLMVAWPNETTAVLAVAVGMAAPTVVGAWVMRDKRTNEGPHGSHPLRRVATETAHNSQALLAYYALSNVDMIIARNVVDAHNSGLYAAGLIITKIMVFLPQFVVVVTFPTMSTPTERLKSLAKGLGLIALLGAVGTVAIWSLSEWALSFGGQGSYVEVQPMLWMFSLLGTVLAMLQLLVYSALAQQAGKASLLMWLGLVAMVVLGLNTSTIEGLVTVVLAVDVALLLILFVLAIRPGAPAPAAPEVVELTAES